MDDSARGGSRDFRTHEGRSGAGGRAVHGRRMPAPETTGAEASYLLEHKETRAPMILTLLDGEEVRGIIEYYDAQMIKINRLQGQNLFIRKCNIRYMREDPNPTPRIP